ncbi:MAG: methyltransferase domain-containing protein [Rhizobiaceae bacterium]
MSSSQRWDSNSYQRDTGFVSHYGTDLLSWLEPQSDEDILDLGCGDGVLTEKIAATGARVIGVDASDSFVASARAAGLDAREMDAHDLPFDQQFDGVFSNAALHWMLQPERVIASVGCSLRPHGRFVGEFGGFGNVAAIVTAMRLVAVDMRGDAELANPWFFPTIDQYTALLVDQEFTVEKIISFHRPTPLPTGMRSWLKVMRRPFFDQFDDRAEEALDRVEAALKPSLCDHTGQWFADYVRLRFRARLGG